MPERVTYLREVLDSDPSRLKEVFLESLKLESLRFALVDEIQLSRGRRSSVAATTATGTHTRVCHLTGLMFMSVSVLHSHTDFMAP